MTIKRLYIDLEVSPNIMLSWRAGYKINLSPDDILQERAIICVCYKWEGSSQINSITWNKGDDRELVMKFTKILQSADEVVAHNGDRFDVKWFKTRCIYHGVDCPPDIKTIDTLKLAKSTFLFNSNKLDYIGGFLGLGNKYKTEYSLWKKILLNNSASALKEMTAYCKRDVELLEKVYLKMKNYTKHKTHEAVLSGGEKIDCPECGSENTKYSKARISAAGLKQVQLQCQDCGKYHTVAGTTYAVQIKERNRKDK